MKYCLVLLLGGLLGFSSVASAAGDPAAGKKKAVMCASCHGAQGISIGPLWPNLAGQKAPYLEKQMRDFRSGKRSDPMMAPLMKPLSDDDIANLAAYYSQLGK